MDFILTPEIIAILFSAAIIAGIIDTIAGGGGLITVPALLIAQVPPVTALATNKLQGSFGTFYSALIMLKKNVISLKNMKKSILYALGGSLIGAILVQYIDSKSIELLIPITIFTMMIYFLFFAKQQESDEPLLTKRKYNISILPFIGFYDGALGPGAGTLYTTAGTALRSCSLVKATAKAKLLNFVTNFASLIIFCVGGHVLWIAGLIMICGQIIGVSIGSKLLLGPKGQRLIRPLILTICSLLLGKYMIDLF